MINLKSGFLIFKKNIFQSIIVIILLIVCFLGLENIVTLVNEQYYILNKFKTFQCNLGVCYNNTSENENIYNKITNIENINYIYNDSIKDVNKKTYNCLNYDDFFENCLDIPLIKGKWYTDVEQPEGEYNAVIEERSGLHVGDKIYCKINDMDITFNITGIIINEFSYISISNIYNLKNYINFVDKNKSLPYLISNYKFANKNITDENLQKNYKILDTYGNYAVLDDIYKNTKIDIDEEMKIYIPLISFFILLTISILLSVCLLTIDKSKTLLTIIKFCGGKKINYILALLCYFSAMFLLPFIIFMCFYWWLYYIPIIVFALLIVFASLLGIKIYNKEISKLNKE